MATPTYIPLANITLTSAVTTVTFSSISQSYRDLVLVANYTVDNGATDVLFSGLGSSGSNTVAYASSSTPASTTSTNATFSRAIVSNPGTGLVVSTLNIFDYSTADKVKTVLMRTSANGAYVDMRVARGAATTAVSSFSIAASATSTKFNIGSTFALYGIAA